MSAKPTHFFWFRRDLRLDDNHGFFEALLGDLPVQPVFIFDTEILDSLPADDHRVNFIYDALEDMQRNIEEYGASLIIRKGKPVEVWAGLLEEFTIRKVTYNRDYEPYAQERDQQVTDLLRKHDVGVYDYKDHVFYEKDEVLKDDGDPYVVYTPYKRVWMERFKKEGLPNYPSEMQLNNLAKGKHDFPSKNDLGIQPSDIPPPEMYYDAIDNYDKTRDFPAKNGTTQAGVHLRFGTVSIRRLVKKGEELNETYLSELVWRDFFSQILYHFPRVVTESFKEKYDGIEWENNEEQFEKWKKGETGYPMVDAGMRELNQTGYMHNRVRMVVASFLCKHLLIDWRWGEGYFAEKLFDYDLASNNGNWQWAAGCGCDAAPYFRIFNPESQMDKFDKQRNYIKKWIPEYGTDRYAERMVDHKEARERTLDRYKDGIN